MSELDTSQFTGTTTWYRPAIYREFLYTDGVQYVAETAGAYWLLDLIFSRARLPVAAIEEFQVWTLKVTDHKAKLVLTDGHTENPILTVDVPFTDFPESGIVMWLVDSTLLLPSEY